MKTAAMLCSNTHYNIQPQSISEHDIIQSQLNFFSSKLNPRHFALIKHIIASFYTLPKPQKDPVGARPVCAAHDSIASIAHRVIVRALRCVKATLREHDNNTFKNGGPRTSWVIESAIEFIIQSPQLIEYAVTADVKDMYHELNQGFLINSVSNEINRACTIKNCDSFTIQIHNTKYNNKDDHGAWTNSPGSQDFNERYTATYSAQTIIDLIKFTMTNCFMSLGDRIFHQKTGIPMGAHSSGDIADISTSSLERDFVLSNPMSPVQFGIWRLIDDVLSINLPNFPLLLSDIYPPKYGYSFTITHSTTSSFSPININFLDITIFADEASNLHTKLYDKRKDFNFEIIKFPDVHSCVSLNQTLDTVYTEFVRFYNIHSRKTS
jgi:hypothetical protein